MLLRQLLILLLASASLGACRYPGQAREQDASQSIGVSDRTALGRGTLERAALHPGQSGLYTLSSGLDAFAARVGLVDHAQETLDVQYYIFHDDLTGRWLLSRLVAAADRGVRVRLLLDDLGSSGIDGLLAAMDQHPQIEVRLFNPFARGLLGSGLARGLDGLSRARRLNHRMHNKLLQADGAGAIVGGRNVGDEYFDAEAGVNFADLDMLVFGPVNEALAESFDLYWNCRFVSPIDGWAAFEARPDALQELRLELLAWEEAHAASPYAQRLSKSQLVQAATKGDLQLTWAATHAAADLPEKIVARGDEVQATLLLERMKSHWPSVEAELLIVSPYFVPRDKGVEYLCGLVQRGVRVRVLTNSLAATDVPAVHSGYAAYRRDLLAGGVELFELRPRGKALTAAHESGLVGSSAASLHAKTFIGDNRRLFVGSLNLDPRSIELNTELGLVIESPSLAAEVTRSIQRAMEPDLSWSVTLEEKKLVWRGMRQGQPVVLEQEPDSGWWKRLSVDMLGWLPIKGQL